MPEKESPKIDDIRKAYSHMAVKCNEEPAPVDDETLARMGEIAAAIRNNEAVADRRAIEEGLYGDIEGYEGPVGEQ